MHISERELERIWSSEWSLYYYLSLYLTTAPLVKGPHGPNKVIIMSHEVKSMFQKGVGMPHEVISMCYEVIHMSHDVISMSHEVKSMSHEVISMSHKVISMSH